MPKMFGVVFLCVQFLVLPVHASSEPAVHYSSATVVHYSAGKDADSPTWWQDALEMLRAVAQALAVGLNGQPFNIPGK